MSETWERVEAYKGQNEMNGKEDNTTSNNDLESIANQVFDDAGVNDDTDLEFVSGKEAIAELNNNVVDDSEKVQESVDQPEKKPLETVPAEKLLAGKFKTVDELVAAYNEKTQAPVATTVQPVQKPQTEEEGTPDLDQREFNILMEQDEQDGTDYRKQYLQEKIGQRNLTNFELEALKAIDIEEGSNLFQEYIAISTERSVMEKLQPVLQPIQEKENKEKFRAYVENEKTINENTVKEFGDRLETLEGKLKEVGYINTVLATSPTAGIINNLWNNGQKALSHRMLLQEADRYERAIQNDVATRKRNSSVQADIGTSVASNKKVVDKAATIEEAWDLSMAEN